MLSDDTVDAMRGEFVAACLADVGTVEDPPGSNRGKKVDQFILSAGLDPTRGSYPWCACFLNFHFRAVCRAHGAVHHFKLGASVPDIVNRARNEGRIISGEHVKPGMLWVPLDQHNHPYHIEVCTSTLDADLLVHTIGGNTSRSPGINPNGGGVWAKKRHAPAELFIDIWEGISD